MIPVSWRRQIAAALAATSVLVLLGAPLGLVWGALAPRLRFVVAAGGQGLSLANSESEALIAADGYFLFMTAVAGVACGIAAYRVGRTRFGPGMIAGLGAGGVAASVVADQVGHRLHNISLDQADKITTVGRHVDLFVSVRAEPALLAWGFAGVLTYGLLVAVFERE